MKKVPFLLVSIFMMVLQACNETRLVELDHEPVMQMDATVYNGDTTIQVTLRRSFNSTGRAEFSIPRSDLYVSNVTLALERTFGTQILEEGVQGKYSFRLATPLQSLETIKLKTQWQGKPVEATATIPPAFNVTYKITHSNPGGSAFRLILRRAADFGLDTFFVHQRKIRAAILKPDRKVIMRMNSEDEIKLVSEQKYLGNPLGLNNPPPFEGRGMSTLLFDPATYLAADSVIWVKDVYFLVNPRDRDNPPPGKLRLDFVNPDPIYFDYASTFNSQIVPLTVTNVKNGVGLVLSASRNAHVVNIPLR
jgi:hypothetical protein